MCPREDGDVPEPQPTTEWRFSTSPRTDQPALPCGGREGAMAFRSWHPGTGPSSALKAPRGPCQPCQLPLRCGPWPFNQEQHRPWIPSSDWVLVP